MMSFYEYLKDSAKLYKTVFSFFVFFFANSQGLLSLMYLLHSLTNFQISDKALWSSYLSINKDIFLKFCI